MTATVYIIIAFAAGAVAAWLYARSHYASGHTLALGASEASARALETLTNELRQQAAQKDIEIISLRGVLDEERRSRVEASTKLASAQEHFREQKSLIEAMKQEMTDTFNALSGAALNSNNEQFLTLAKSQLGAVVEETKKHIGVHTSDMDGMVKPLAEMLRRYEEEIKKIEASRREAYGSLTEQLRQVSLTQETLKNETGNLVAALRKPQVRGRWGEMQLKRAAELSGMSAHCDFTEQVSVETDSGAQRPDMVVRLPAGRVVVVDAKAPLDAYLEAVEAATEDERREKLVKHAQQVRTHMNKLSSKEYWSRFKDTPEIVVMFLPGESFFSAALDFDPTLIEEGMRKKVIIATPTTFIALLRSIAYGWRQEALAENAQKISDLGRELHERMAVFVTHLADLGRGISRVTDQYNETVRSFETRALVSMKKFSELGAGSGKAIVELKTVEVSPSAPRAEVKNGSMQRGADGD